MKIKAVGKWVWDYWSRLSAGCLLGYILYLFLGQIGEEHASGVYSYEMVLTAVGIWLMFALIMFSAGREGYVSPKRYRLMLDSAAGDTERFLQLTMQAETDHMKCEIRLANAKIMLRARASEMPDCSRKALLLKEVDEL